MKLVDTANLALILVIFKKSPWIILQVKRYAFLNKESSNFFLLRNIFINSAVIQNQLHYSHLIREDNSVGVQSPSFSKSKPDFHSLPAPTQKRMRTFFQA
uniref:Uncharacterized protein n=1 Tax=Aplanochytrium stocchinoi TaxID=215587 RepID=A0A6S8B788_9STRA|mmetsp:Transcript_21974/g.26780  ORF Transcript_21974/g.26780 Transcript_21974/m.26780 type:complete len:100 (-) Transcript_21974:251-550(-)